VPYAHEYFYTPMMPRIVEGIIDTMTF
jgi:hypothetical protein